MKMAQSDFVDCGPRDPPSTDPLCGVYYFTGVGIKMRQRTSDLLEWVQEVGIRFPRGEGQGRVWGRAGFSRFHACRAGHGVLSGRGLARARPVTSSKIAHGSEKREYAGLGRKLGGLTHVAWVYKKNTVGGFRVGVSFAASRAESQLPGVYAQSGKGGAPVAC